MHSFYQAAEQAKIVVRGGSQRCAIRRGMHVRNVRADGEVNGYRQAKLVCIEYNACMCVLRQQPAAGEELARRFSIPNTRKRGSTGNLVQEQSGFRRPA